MKYIVRDVFCINDVHVDLACSASVYCALVYLHKSYDQHLVLTHCTYVHQSKMITFNQFLPDVPIANDVLSTSLPDDNSVPLSAADTNVLDTSSKYWSADISRPGDTISVKR